MNFNYGSQQQQQQKYKNNSTISNDTNDNNNNNTSSSRTYNGRTEFVANNKYGSTILSAETNSDASGDAYQQQQQFHHSSGGCELSYNYASAKNRKQQQLQQIIGKWFIQKRIILSIFLLPLCMMITLPIGYVCCKFIVFTSIFGTPNPVKYYSKVTIVLAILIVIGCTYGFWEYIRTVVIPRLAFHSPIHIQHARQVNVVRIPLVTYTLFCMSAQKFIFTTTISNSAVITGILSVGCKILQNYWIVQCVLIKIGSISILVSSCIGFQFTDTFITLFIQPILSMVGGVFAARTNRNESSKQEQQFFVHQFYKHTVLCPTIPKVQRIPLSATSSKHHQPMHNMNSSTTSVLYIHLMFAFIVGFFIYIPIFGFTNTREVTSSSATLDYHYNHDFSANKAIKTTAPTEWVRLSNYITCCFIVPFIVAQRIGQRNSSNQFSCNDINPMVYWQLLQLRQKRSNSHPWMLSCFKDHISTMLTQYRSTGRSRFCTVLVVPFLAILTSTLYSHMIISETTTSGIPLGVILDLLSLTAYRQFAQLTLLSLCLYWYSQFIDHIMRYSLFGGGIEPFDLHNIVNDEYHNNKYDTDSYGNILNGLSIMSSKYKQLDVIVHSLLYMNTNVISKLRSPTFTTDYLNTDPMIAEIGLLDRLSKVLAHDVESPSNLAAAQLGQDILRLNILEWFAGISCSSSNVIDNIPSSYLTTTPSRTHDDRVDGWIQISFRTMQHQRKYSYSNQGAEEHPAILIVRSFLVYMGLVGEILEQGGSSSNIRTSSDSSIPCSVFIGLKCAMCATVRFLERSFLHRDTTNSPNILHNTIPAIFNALFALRYGCYVYMERCCGNSSINNMVNATKLYSSNNSPELVSLLQYCDDVASDIIVILQRHQQNEQNSMLQTKCYSPNCWNWMQQLVKLLNAKSQQTATTTTTKMLEKHEDNTDDIYLIEE